MHIPFDTTLDLVICFRDSRGLVDASTANAFGLMHHQGIKPFSALCLASSD